MTTSTITSDSVSVLDHGYVRLVDKLGDEVTILNAARVSYDKATGWEYDCDDTGCTKFLTDRDYRLLKYLLKHGHTSPLRHVVLQFEVYAPLMVMRQWGKYRVGGAWLFEDSDDPLETWNESSRRYVTEEPVFYSPGVRYVNTSVPPYEEDDTIAWREAPENKKQGSGDPITDERDLVLSVDMDTHIKQSLSLYQDVLKFGVCPEQARLFLPAYAMYVRAYWTVSLQGVLHFLEQRLGDDSQWEIQQYAGAVMGLLENEFSTLLDVMCEVDAESNG